MAIINQEEWEKFVDEHEDERRKLIDLLCEIMAKATKTGADKEGMQYIILTAVLGTFCSVFKNKPVKLLQEVLLLNELTNKILENVVKGVVKEGE